MVNTYVVVEKIIQRVNVQSNVRFVIREYLLK